MKYVLMICIAVLCVAGCEQWAERVADPCSSLNRAVDTVSAVAPVVGSGAAATGTPWGAAVGGIAAVLVALTSVYKNHQKNIVINEKDSHIWDTETATRAMIEAIEEVKDVKVGSKTLGVIVKAAVKKKLEDESFYKTGKAIISGLKPLPAPTMKLL